MPATSTTLDEAFDPRNNSIDFLRFLMAAFVVHSHGYALAGLGLEPECKYLKFNEGLSLLGLAGFFALSGFLITRSFLSAPSTGRFLWHRALRILPGFWACLLFGACIVAPLAYWLNHSSLSGYWESTGPSSLAYVYRNLFLKVKQFYIAGIWEDLKFPRSVDGSLWSLHPEFRCYVLVAVLGFLGVLKRSRQIVLVLFCLLWGLHVLESAVPGAALKALPYFNTVAVLRLTIWFLAGMVFFLYRELVVVDTRLGVAALVLTVWSMSNNCTAVMLPLTMPYLLFWSAIKLPLQGFGRRGDYSYGLYIYAFPVQQFLASSGVQKWGGTLFFVLSMLATLPLAWLSYHFVEKPALRLKGLSWKFKRIAGASETSHADATATIELTQPEANSPLRKAA